MPDPGREFLLRVGPSADGQGCEATCQPCVTADHTRRHDAWFGQYVGTVDVFSGQASTALAACLAALANAQLPEVDSHGQ